MFKEKDGLHNNGIIPRERNTRDRYACGSLAVFWRERGGRLAYGLFIKLCIL